MSVDPLIKKYFPPQEWATAQAVMLAESGGNPQAHNDNPKTGDDSWGLFQINRFGDLAKSRPDPSVLTDPEKNVAYAAQIWSRQGWQPWGSYTSGGYKKYLDQGFSDIVDKFLAATGAENQPTQVQPQSPTQINYTGQDLAPYMTQPYMMNGHMVDPNAQKQSSNPILDWLNQITNGKLVSPVPNKMVSPEPMSENLPRKLTDRTRTSI